MLSQEPFFNTVVKMSEAYLTSLMKETQLEAVPIATLPTVDPQDCRCDVCIHTFSNSTPNEVQLCRLCSVRVCVRSGRVTDAKSETRVCLS